jgi:hypothetical protein
MEPPLQPNVIARLRQFRFRQETEHVVVRESCLGKCQVSWLSSSMRSRIVSPCLIECLHRANFELLRRADRLDDGQRDEV